MLVEYNNDYNILLRLYVWSVACKKVKLRCQSTRVILTPTS